MCNVISRIRATKIVVYIPSNAGGEDGPAWDPQVRLRVGREGLDGEFVPVYNARDTL